MSQSLLLDAETKPRPVQQLAKAVLALTVGHALIDCLASLMPSSLGLIEVRCGLTPAQSAWLLGLGSLTSGLSQPISALVSDSLRTRRLVFVGILLAGLGFGTIGLARSISSLAVFYVLGMIGNGAFHPVAATTMAQLDRSRRNSATGVFFVAGMIGGFSGAMLWPRWLSHVFGFETLPYIILPIFLVAFGVQQSLSQLPALPEHKPEELDLHALRGNWRNVGILYVASAVRYCVNTALIYLFVRWTQHVVAADHANWSAATIAKAAAPMAGNLNAAMITGMACGGLLAGALIKPDREKRPMIWVPLLFAPVVALFPHLAVKASYVLALLAGIGFSAAIPITVALAQHLLPHRANLAASLMMGGAWMLASIGPRSAEFGVTHFGLETTFLLTGGLLAASGIVCTLLRGPKTAASY